MPRSAERPLPRPLRNVVRTSIVAVVCAALALLAACTAGTAGTVGHQDSGTSGQPSDSSRYLNFFPCCSWGNTWSYNPYNVNAIGFTTSLASLRLAIRNVPSLTSYTPQLADRWTASDGKLAVHLREDATWQDGKPVTSKDFYDTVILNGTRGDGFWNDITDVTATDEHTVTFTLKKDQPIQLAKNDILGMIVIPSSVYGRFVTDKLATDVKTYFRTAQQDPDKAAKLPEFQRMGAAFKKLAAYKVSQYIGNGPFRLRNITIKEAKLDKWDGFWGADKIKFGGINYFNGSNQAAYPQLLSGGVDLSTVYMPPPVQKQWQNTPEAKMALPLSFGFVLGFNNNRYPLNLKEVRQALAYVIPRQQMTEAAYGTRSGGGGSWKEISTGISPTLEKLYLTEDQLNQLNKYPLDPDKASQLLESKGFTKKGGQWMTPKGKPFTLTFTANSGTSDIVTSFNSAAKALTAFGIKSDLNATSGAQQDADQHNGDFDIGMFFVGGTNPLGMYNAILHDQNYTGSGNYAGKRGIGFGPTANVPGLGNVNVPNTILKQSKEVAPGPDMNAAVWNWAQLVNEQVPYIWYATKVYQFSYSTKEFGNWPPKDQNGTSELWDIIGNNTGAGMSLAFQQGYVVPK